MVANLTRPSPYFRGMKYSITIIFPLLMACSHGQNHSPATKEGKKVIPEFAKGFEIIEQNNGFSLILFDLENPGDTLEVIGFDSIPARKITCLSTTHVSFLDKIGALSLCKGVAFADLVRNTNARNAIENQEIANLSSSEDVDMEKLLATGSEYFFVYPYGHGNYEKYTSKGIACIPVSEYLERHPLGRLEWIKVFGYVLGKRQEADRYFEHVKARYLELCEETKNEDNTARPCVFTGSEEAGVWYAPPGNSFQSKLIHDAGGNYILKDTISNGNITLPFERLLLLAHDCDFWGKVEFSPTPLTAKEIMKKDSRYAQLRAVKENHIFLCNTNEADYFGDAVVEPDVLLQDLWHIFRETPGEMYHYQYFKPSLPDTQD